LTKISVLAADKGNFVAAMLDPGMRAIAIDVSASSMVGGFIGPGDYVDLVLTYDLRINYDKDDPLAEKLVTENLYKTATETIAQNIKVLAIDQSAVRPEDEAIKIAKTVTLAVDLQTAESMALAQEMGDITLVLRGVGDDKIVSKDWKTISDIRMVKVDDEILEEYEDMSSQQYTGKNGQTMQIYNGGSVSTVPISQ
jgi:pilus assembly protein CpaB